MQHSLESHQASRWDQQEPLDAAEQQNPHTRMSCRAYQATGETDFLLGRQGGTSKASLVMATAQCLCARTTLTLLTGTPHSGDQKQVAHRK